MTVTDAPAVRECGKCHLCCKLLIVPELEKPDGQWCAHCEIGMGCTIYERRPKTCSDFKCMYLRDPALGEAWHPARAHFLMRTTDTQLVVQVDPQRPDAWKREPYHTALRKHAGTVYQRGGQVVVKIADRVFAILPDRDVDLGICQEGDRLVCTPQFTPTGVRWNAVRVPAQR